jgi:hypothetical protein
MLVEQLEARTVAAEDGAEVVAEAKLTILWVESPTLRPRIYSCSYGCGAENCLHRASDAFPGWCLELMANRRQGTPDEIFYLLPATVIAHRELAVGRKGGVWGEERRTGGGGLTRLREPEARAILAGDSTPLLGMLEPFSNLKDVTVLDAMARRVFSLYFEEFRTRRRSVRLSRATGVEL